jgi:dTMP kinase
MQLGQFITIEGGEGVGKSTQIETIRATVQAAGFETLLTREPGGTERAERIRDLLLTPTNEAMPTACELLLMFAARSAHVTNLILPTLAQGKWVICDRFTDATYAYQGAGRGVPRTDIAVLETMAIDGLKPNLTLLLDAPIELSLARARKRNLERGAAAGDRFEREQEEFFKRVREAYLAIARADPNRIAVIDASRSVDEVKTSVAEAVRKFINRVGKQ